MSQGRQRADITRKAVVYQMPGMEAVMVRRDIEHRAAPGGVLTMDIYYPPDRRSGARVPAVLFVVGFSDEGAEARLGCKFKEMASYVSWARLVAASGLAAVTYTNREPAADLSALRQYLQQNAGSLGLDEKSMGLWACSGNVPLALSTLMQEARNRPKCAVLSYGYMLDLEGSTSVADASKQWGFANPCAGKSVRHLPQETPLFLVRAGQDQMPHLNETIDAFVAAASACNLPITFVNHPAAPHAFDLLHDSETSREIIRQILAFLRFHLLAQGSGSG